MRYQNWVRLVGRQGLAQSPTQLLPEQYPVVVNCLCIELVSWLALVNIKIYKFEKQIYHSIFVQSISLLKGRALNLEAVLKVQPSREQRQCWMWDRVEIWAKAQEFWCCESPSACPEPPGVADIEDSQLKYILYINFFHCVNFHLKLIVSLGIFWY